MNTSAEASIKATFQEHYDEIQRRVEVGQQGLQDAATFTKVEHATAHPFRSQDQLYIVFSLSTTHFAPKAVDASNPAVCIYGAFPTREEAVDYAKEVVLTHHPGHSILVDETHKWITAASEPDHLREEYVDAHTKDLLKRHHELLNTNLKEFQDNLKEQKMGSVETKDGDAKKSAAETVEKGKSHRINANLDVRGQKLAVVSFVKDTKTPAEFLFRVYAFFDNEHDANSYVRNTCGDNVQDFDIDVIQTCTWAFPQTMTYQTASKEVFRSDELDKIMQNHRSQPQQVANFKNMMTKSDGSSDDGTHIEASRDD